MRLSSSACFLLFCRKSGLRHAPALTTPLSLTAASFRDFAAAAKIVASWDFDTVVPCHGDVLESGGKEAFISTYEAVLKA